jgi:hypothetical protein
MPYFPGKFSYTIDTTRYPRMGKLWSKDEDQKLLASIKDRDSIKTIAERHGRTEGGITSHLKSIAVKAYIIDKEPVEIISKETGLTAAEIMFEVRKKESADKKKDKPVAVKSEVTLEDIMRELKEIRRMLESL